MLYTYDAHDRLIRKQVDADGDGVIDRSESLVYDGGDVVLIHDETGSFKNRYLHGDLTDQVFMQENIGEILWGLADNQGTIRDVANYDPLTDTSSVLNHRQFDTFGGITSETNSSVNYRYAYTGRYFDEDTGIQYNRGRWYQAGRWLSEDPIGFEGGDANLNRYVGNSPTNATDPTGLYLIVDADERKAVETWLGRKNVTFEPVTDSWDGVPRWRAVPTQAAWDAFKNYPSDPLFNMGLRQFIFDERRDHRMSAAMAGTLEFVTRNLRLQNSHAARIREWGHSGFGFGISTTCRLAERPTAVGLGRNTMIARPGDFVTGSATINGRIVPTTNTYLTTEHAIDSLEGQVSGFLQKHGDMILLGLAILDAVPGDEVAVASRMASRRFVPRTGEANVSELRGRQLASEFTGNKINRFRRQMQAQGGYGDFPPIKIAIVDGKKIIIDGHHRARAAGAAGIKDVPVEIIDLAPRVARKYFEQAAEAAERLGLPF